MPLHPDTQFQGLRQDDYEVNGLMLRLPPTRGAQIPNAPLADQTWFRVGGPAEVLFKPADVEDLSYFLAHCPQDIPLTILGTASNTLIRDGGIPGVVIKLGPAFASITVESSSLTAGAGAMDLNVARAAQSAGIAGMEFLCGIPGTVGGGLRMNAGAHGGEFKDIVLTVKALDRAGNPRTLYNAQMGFSYRHSDAPLDWFFIEATLAGEADDPGAILRRMQAIQKTRVENQPIREKTGGSTFANPDNDPQGRKAWQLIDAAGCRGLKIGQAMVSEKHCNFLINTGHATATEIEALGEEVRRRVKQHSGIDLRWEIRRQGLPLPPADQS